MNQIYSVLLILSDLFVLSDSYGFIDLEKMTYSFIWVTFGYELFNGRNAFLIFKLVILLSLSWAHVRTFVQHYNKGFTEGYHSSGGILKETSATVYNAYGDDTHGSPVGNIRPRLFTRSHKLGSFTNGYDKNTGPITVVFSLGTHIFAIFRGIYFVLLKTQPGIFLFPLLLTIWAVYSLFWL